jgi:hypothetical protein
VLFGSADALPESAEFLYELSPPSTSMSSTHSAQAFHNHKHTLFVHGPKTDEVEVKRHAVVVAYKTTPGTPQPHDRTCMHIRDIPIILSFIPSPSPPADQRSLFARTLLPFCLPLPQPAAGQRPASGLVIRSVGRVEGYVCGRRPRRHRATAATSVIARRSPAAGPMAWGMLADSRSGVAAPHHCCSRADSITNVAAVAQRPSRR